MGLNNAPVDIVQFSVLGQTITIGEERCLYNQLRHIYNELADICLKKFTSFYSENRGLDDVIKNVNDQAYAAMLPAIKQSVEILVRYQVYTVDVESFFTNYVLPRETWSNAYQVIADRYSEIVYDKEQQDAYRRSCRENRGRWIGGGFGVSGAVKGAVTAGFLNTASGMGHSIWNGLGRMASSYTANQEKKALFNKLAKDRLFHNVLRANVFDMHLALAICIADHTNENVFLQGAIKKDDSVKLKAVMKNICMISSRDEQKAVLAASFNLNPYFEDWYTYAYDTFGDPNGELERLANYFHIPVIALRKKADIAQYASQLSLNTEQEAVRAKELLLAHIKEISYSGTCEELVKIDGCLADFDHNARTVDGITFETREEAEKNRSEYELINNLISAANPQDPDSLRNVLYQISGCSTKIAEKYRGKLLQEICDLEESIRKEKERLDILSRTVILNFENKQSVLMPSQEEAQFTQQYADEIDVLIKNCENRSFGSYYKVVFLRELLNAIRTDKRYEQIPTIAYQYEEFVEGLYQAALENQESLLSSVMKKYADAKSKSQYQYRVYMGRDLSENSRIVNNAKAAYMYVHGYSDGEKIILLHDATMGKNGKVGFAITEKGIYHSDGFIARENIRRSDMKVGDYGNFVIDGQNVKNFYLPFDLQDIWTIIETSPFSDMKMCVYLSKSEQAREFEKKKIIYRIFERYQDYHNAFGGSVDVAKEIEDSISSGNVFNYTEIALYGDIILKNFSENETSLMSIYPISKSEKTEYHGRILSLLKEKANLSAYEQPLFFYIQRENRYCGFVITSKGVYHFSKPTNAAYFAPFSKSLIPIWHTEETVMRLGKEEIDISYIDASNRKKFIDLVSFFIEKVPVVNVFALRKLEEKVKHGELPRETYRQYLTGFYHESKSTLAAPAGYAPKQRTKKDAINKCTYCGATIKEGKSFCTQCGKSVEKTAPVAQMLYCPHCNGKVKPSNTFCNHCGKRLKT